MICGFSQKPNDNCSTPRDFFDELNEEFHFNHDPCPLFGHNNPERDGLKTEWKERNYVNPPYSQIGKWTEKCVEEYKKGKFIVLLIPLRPSNKYYFENIYPYATEIRMLRKGLCFGQFDTPFPHPLAIIVFDPVRNQGRTRSPIEKKTYKYLEWKLQE